MISATPSQYGVANRPVEKVSWEDIQVFLTRLNEHKQINSRRVGVCITYGSPVGVCLPGRLRPQLTRGEYDNYRSDSNYNDSGYSQTRDVGSTVPTPGAFLICTAMFGNGLPMSIISMPVVL